MRAAAAPFGHVDAAVAVGGDRVWRPELTGLGAARAPRHQILAVLVELDDTRVAVSVAHEEGAKLDNTLTVTPPDEIEALKTRAHWEGPSLHLHFKKGMNFGRDVLSLNGGTLSILRDLESGGGSTTRTITYAKAS